MQDQISESPLTRKLDRHSPIFRKWEGAGNTALSRLFGGESRHLRAYRDVSYEAYGYEGQEPTLEEEQHVFQLGISSAVAIMQGALDEFRRYELPEGEDLTMPAVPRTSVDAPSVIANSSTLGRSISRDSTKIFIVHGHDEEMKQTVARFVSQLDLVPIILHEQPNKGTTIIEKFEANTDVAFAIVLLDLSRLFGTLG